MSKLIAVLLLVTPLLLPACAGPPADQPTATTENPGEPLRLTDATSADENELDLSSVRLTEAKVRRAFEAYFAMLEAIAADPERYASMWEDEEDDADAMGEDMLRYPELERIVEAKGVKMEEMATVMAAVSMAWLAQNAPPEAQSYYENVPQHREFVAGHPELVQALLDRMDALGEELNSAGRDS